MNKTWNILLPGGQIVTHHRQDQPDGSKKVWWSIDGNNGLNGMKVSDLPLYGSERLTPEDTEVVITEGEKAADALLDRRIVAVGTVTGASHTPSDESLSVLRGRTVYLWVDNDEVGRKHMDGIAAQLFKLGVDDIRDIEWTEAQNKGDDAADFTGDNTELQKLLEAATPVEKPDGNLPELLDAVCKFIKKYVVLTPQQADAIALWVLHTYVFDVAETTPYLSITSPEKRSGKTRLLETLSLITRNPWYTGRTSAAALYRKVDKLRPTLLFDEADATFKGDKEFNETLRGILNSGHRTGGVVTLAVGQGSKFDVQDFSTFCPKAMAGIGKLPDTVADRSIPIELKRRTRSEEVARFRFRDAKEEAEPIVNRLVSWAEYNLTQLENARPDISFIVSDRAADGWEPLLAIAELAVSEWSERARRAATMLSNGEEDNQSIGIRLLEDLATVFDKVGADRISSVDLIQELSDMDEAPWGDWYGKPITQRQLSKWLKEFGVSSRSVRIGDKTPKGYRREDFKDPWSRYTPALSATAQHPDSELESVDNGLFGTANVADSNSPEPGQIELEVADVAEKVLITGGSPDYSAYVQDSDDEMRFD